MYIKNRFGIEFSINTIEKQFNNRFRNRLQLIYNDSSKIKHSDIKELMTKTFTDLGFDLEEEKVKECFNLLISKKGRKGSQKATQNRRRRNRPKQDEFKF